MDRLQSIDFNWIMCIACDSGKSILHNRIGTEECPKCGRKFDIPDGFEKKLESPEANHSLVSLLLKSLRVADSDIITAGLIIRPYIGMLARPCTAYRSAIDSFQNCIRDQFLGSGKILFNGIPVAVSKKTKLVHEIVPVSAEDPYLTWEYWYNMEGTLIRNMLSRKFLDGPWEVTPDSVVVDPDTCPADISIQIVRKVKDYMMKLSQYKLDISALSNGDRIVLLKSFYLGHTELVDLSWNALCETVEFLKKDPDTDLLNMAQDQLAQGSIDRISVVLVSEMSPRGQALAILTNRLKRKPKHSRIDTAFLRSEIHRLGAREQLGWCPCDKCSKSSMTSYGKVRRDRP